MSLLKVVVVIALLSVVQLVSAKQGIRKHRQLNILSVHDRLKDKPADVKAAVLAAISHRDYFSKCYCTDSVSFPGNAKIGFSLVTVKPTPVNTFQENSVPIIVQAGDYDNIVSAGDKIYANKAGCCSTFAVAMFAKMAPTSSTKGPRIEIIGVGSGHTGTHVFLVVGRSAGAAGQKPNRFGRGGSFPASSQWGADAVVVDPWLMSLGHDGINEDPVSGPRTALCSSGTCDGSKAPTCLTGETVCYTHGETLGFDGGVLLFEKAKVT